MRSNDIDRLFDNLFELEKAKKAEVTRTTNVDPVTLMSDEDFRVEVETASSVRTEGTAIYRRRKITFRIKRS